MSSLDLTSATSLQVLQSLRKGEVSSVELLDAMLANVEKFNSAVNAVVAMDIERARAEAAAADDLRASGDPMGVLHGLPMTVKDCFETLDLVTTAGAPALADHVPDRDADAVRLLRRAGAIVWAKTNVPLYAGDHQSFNEVYGRTNNPWNLERTAGGSSGGAAAAVACGMTTAELGSDIGNSIRQPAALNGVFGLKTTHGLVSDRGHIPGPPGWLSSFDLGIIGPIARSCGDLRLLLEALTTSRTAFGGVPRAELRRFDQHPDIRDLRIGVWSNDPLAPVSSEITTAIESAAATLESAGAMVDASIRPAMPSEQLHDTYLTLLQAAMAGGVSDEEYESLERIRLGLVEDASPELIDFASRTAVSHRDWQRANETRAHAQRAWRHVFESVDVVLAPVQPVTAFPHDTDRPYGQRTLDVDGTPTPYANILFWAGLATMPLLPSLSIPLGPSEDGLPVGMQLIGPLWGDHRLLSMGEEIASVLGTRFTPPPLVTTSETTG